MNVTTQYVHKVSEAKSAQDPLAVNVHVMAAAACPSQLQECCTAEVTVAVPQILKPALIPATKQ